MKPLAALLTATLLSAASLTGCGWLEERMDIQKQTEKRFRLNPNPKEAYRIRIKIDGAPGPMKLMTEMYTGYKAWNCQYTINHFEGADTEPAKDIQTPMQSIGENEYETVVYFDAMLDEDYFGQGVCHWEPENFGVSFKATGKPEETEFNVSDVMENLLKEKKLVKYYWNGAYPYYRNDDGTVYLRSDGTNFTDFGEPLEWFSPERRQDLFSITITFEEVKP
ncbi:hypothetical protein [Neisseria dentiae]|uniref:hypothetical protein n=1 Tax=Neisseria dentiae TaxID=194197 RepID=UPI0027E15237|nr:hypothetical protein [Neisseria dentiae]